MDRPGVVGQASRNGLEIPCGTVAGRILPSRVTALGRLRWGLESLAGPVVLTGEPGVGKTWLWQQLREAMPREWRWALVELTPAVGPAGFYRLVLRSLGASEGGSADAVSSRLAVEDVLLGTAAEAERWVLVVEEAHNASDEVLEELRVLGNRPGTPGRWHGLLVVGHGGLNRRLATRCLANFGARVVQTTHLRPLNGDEFRDFIREISPGFAEDLDAVEHLQRTVESNPRLASRVLASLSMPARFETLTAVEERVRMTPPATDNERPDNPANGSGSTPTQAELPPVLPSRPPIRVGDGVVEVGWNALPGADAEDEQESADLEVGSPEPLPDLKARGTANLDRSKRAAAPPEVEVVNDHYAALQAWGEWNRFRDPDRLPTETSAADEETSPVAESDSKTDNPQGVTPLPEGVRAEGQQAFAPYSQLFSRLRQTNDAP